jgi:hypothetical protein
MPSIATTYPVGAPLVKEAPQRALPVTSQQTYISELAALNVGFDHEGGDWHFRPHWYVMTNQFGTADGPFPLGGEGTEFNTNPALGNLGVRDITDALLSKGYIPPMDRRPVFAANHLRAVADITYGDTLRRLRPLLTNGEIGAWLGSHKIDELKSDYLLPLRGTLTDQQLRGFDTWLATISPRFSRRTSVIKP